MAASSVLHFQDGLIYYVCSMTEPGRHENENESAPTSEYADAFAREAEKGERGTVGELWDFIRYNKKWWLTPIVAALLLVGVLIVLGSSAVAPFIYTLF
jgi:hypothetical protein